MGHLVLHVAGELVPGRGPIQRLALGFIEAVAESHLLQQLQQQLQILLGLDVRLKQQPNDMGRQEPVKQKALHEQLMQQQGRIPLEKDIEDVNEAGEVVEDVFLEGWAVLKVEQFAALVQGDLAVDVQTLFLQLPLPTQVCVRAHNAHHRVRHAGPHPIEAVPEQGLPGSLMAHQEQLEAGLNCRLGVGQLLLAHPGELAKVVRQHSDLVALQHELLQARQLHNGVRQASEPVTGHVQLLQGSQLQQLPRKSGELIVVHIEGAQAAEAGEGVGQVRQPVKADIQLLQVGQRAQLGGQGGQLVVAEVQLPQLVQGAHHLRAQGRQSVVAHVQLGEVVAQLGHRRGQPGKAVPPQDQDAQAAQRRPQPLGHLLQAVVPQVQHLNVPDVGRQHELGGVGGVDLVGPDPRAAPGRAEGELAQVAPQLPGAQGGVPPQPHRLQVPTVLPSHGGAPGRHPRAGAGAHSSMPRCARAGARLPVAPAPLSPPALGDRRRVLAQPAAGRPQLGGGGDASSSGGRRAGGAGGGGGRRGVPLAFSYLRGHGRAAEDACCSSSAPPAARRLRARSGSATLAAAAPRPAAPSPPRAPGGGRRLARRRACCEHRAGVQPGGGGGGGGTSRSLLPGARERARAPRPRHWEGAIGKRQRRPAARPPRDRRRRRVFPAPPQGRAPGAGTGAPGWVRATWRGRAGSGSWLRTRGPGTSCLDSSVLALCCPQASKNFFSLRVKWEHICSLLRKINCSVFLASVGRTRS
ncbi:uncharacterized protein LOC132226801 [Myotis daubentonii]|uniref:uncharacterized protein LOC132226801 n=1 Tax=Myotis daubentonii TaxID=98922 RepID=UPI002872B1FE|nr:uncharacterized protein LOC132226801 [Myotis daubentonii]